MKNGIETIQWAILLYLLCVVNYHTKNVNVLLDGALKVLKYDRVLCDVPCTGDGTLRKNADIWVKWTPGHANNLYG